MQVKDLICVNVTMALFSASSIVSLGILQEVYELF